MIPWTSGSAAGSPRSRSERSWIQRTRPSGSTIRYSCLGPPVRMNSSLFATTRTRASQSPGSGSLGGRHAADGKPPPLDSRRVRAADVPREAGALEAADDEAGDVRPGAHAVVGGCREGVVVVVPPLAEGEDRDQAV